MKIQPITKLFGTSLTFMLAAYSLCFSSLAQALDSDKYQAIDVSADSAILDDKAGQAIYRGKVVLRQGSLKISADQLTIKANQAGRVEKVIASGHFAKFRQTPNKGEAPLEAKARSVEYNLIAETIVLIDSAKVVQNKNVFEGNVIEYDIKQERLKAHGKRVGGKPQTGKAPGRVKMVLQPQVDSSQARKEKP